MVSSVPQVAKHSQGKLEPLARWDLPPSSQVHCTWFCLALCPALLPIYVLISLCFQEVLSLESKGFRIPTQQMKSSWWWPRLSPLAPLLPICTFRCLHLAWVGDQQGASFSKEMCSHFSGTLGIWMLLFLPSKQYGSPILWPYDLGRTLESPGYVKKKYKFLCLALEILN